MKNFVKIYLLKNFPFQFKSLKQPKIKTFPLFFDAIGPFFGEQDIILGCFDNLN